MAGLRYWGGLRFAGYAFASVYPLTPGNVALVADRFTSGTTAIATPGVGRYPDTIGRSPYARRAPYINGNCGESCNYRLESYDCDQPRRPIHDVVDGPCG